MSVTNVLPDKKTFELILNELSEIEAKHGVKILYACESGSRAWGFASQDSDYDVRFIYVQPVEKYLSIISQRDVIELPITGDLDINGWDLRKALQLFRKSNPPLMEWLVSPLVYLQKYSLADKLRQLMARFYSRSAMSYHYLHMAQGNFRESLMHTNGTKINLVV